jgi:hemerythrin-like domain-containing protein
MADSNAGAATPSDVLKDEHSRIKRVLEVLRLLTTRARDGGGWETESMLLCVEFFRLFADACHHAKEEDLLFPVLEQRGIPRDGGPIGVMLYEHEQGREYVAQMSAALEELANNGNGAEERLLKAADEYIGLLTHHIYKEDYILFPMGDGCLTEDDTASLTEKFCDVACGNFGGKNLEELERIADELEERWGTPE